MDSDDRFVGNIKLGLDDSVDQSLRDIADRSPRAAFVHLFHPDRIGSNDTISRIAWHSPEVKRFLVELTNMGYSAYLTKTGESRLVHRSRLGGLWAPLRDGKYDESEEGQIFDYSPPISGRPASGLLVVFSSVFEDVHSSSLGRYFNRTFLSIQKYLPPDLGVLRVADVGGVLGAFYMNTQFRPDNESRTGRFILSFIESLGIDIGRVVLYGASKGGTASLSYGLRLGIKFVAVDPIVDDLYYHRILNDLHFTDTSIFLESKVDMFDRIFRQFIDAGEDSGSTPRGVSRSVICSEGSPLFPYLERSAVLALHDHVSFFKSNNPKITTHPDVARNTIHVLTMILNAYFYGLVFPAGVIEVD